MGEEPSLNTPHPLSTASCVSLWLWRRGEGLPERERTKTKLPEGLDGSVGRRKETVRGAQQQEWEVRELVPQEPTPGEHSRHHNHQHASSSPKSLPGWSVSHCALLLPGFRLLCWVVNFRPGFLSVFKWCPGLLERHWCLLLCCVALCIRQDVCVPCWRFFL